LPKNSIIAWLLPTLSLLVGILGMSAVWVAAATLSDSPCSWLALLAAIDMALLLKLTNAPPGRLRMIAAMLATAAAVGLSQWLVVATQLGISLGMAPLASSLRLGPALAWQLSWLNLDSSDWILLLASLPLAAILTQSRRVSGRRPGP
jgi:hypothetical protein